MRMRKAVLAGSVKSERTGTSFLCHDRVFDGSQGPSARQTRTTSSVVAAAVTVVATAAVLVPPCFQEQAGLVIPI